MGSENKGRSWAANLCHNIDTLCSEADDMICQLCFEFVEDVLPNVLLDSIGENGLPSPAREKNGKLPAQKLLSTGVDSDQDGESCTVNSASTLSSIEPLVERRTKIPSDGKDEISNWLGKQTFDGDECNGHAHSSTSIQHPVASEETEESRNIYVEFQEYEPSDDEATCSSSSSTKAIHSNDISAGVAADQGVNELRVESHLPCGHQKLDESIIMVSSEECYSDSDTDANHPCVQKNKNLANKFPSESVSQGICGEIYQITENYCTELQCAKDSKMVNEDFCDSDWEIV